MRRRACARLSGRSGRSRAVSRPVSASRSRAIDLEAKRDDAVEIGARRHRDDEFRQRTRSRRPRLARRWRRGHAARTRAIIVIVIIAPVVVVIGKRLRDRKPLPDRRERERAEKRGEQQDDDSPGKVHGTPNVTWLKNSTRAE